MQNLVKKNRTKATTEQGAYRRKIMREKLEIHKKAKSDMVIELSDFVNEMINYCKGIANKEEAEDWGPLFNQSNATRNIRALLPSMGYKVDGGYIYITIDDEQRKIARNLYHMLPKNKNGDLDIKIYINSRAEGKYMYSTHVYIQCDSFQLVCYFSELIFKLFKKEISGIMVGIGVLDIRCEKKENSELVDMRLNQMITGTFDVLNLKC